MRLPPFAGQEQQPLGQEVVLEGRVEVEMVARQVGERDGVEVDAGRAVESQGVRRRLHDAASSPASTICRNMRCRSSDSAVVSVTGVSTPAMRLTTVPSRAVGSPAAAVMPASRWAIVVLPLVPVTAASAQFTRRLAVEPGRHARHRRARAGHDELGHGEIEGPLADERYGAGRHGGRRELVTVGASAGDAEEQRPGDDIAGVAGERSDLDVGSRR